MAAGPQALLVLQARNSPLALLGGPMFAGLGLLMLTRGVNGASLGFAVVFVLMAAASVISARQVIALDPSVPALLVWRGIGRLGWRQTTVLPPSSSVRTVTQPHPETGEPWPLLFIGPELVPFVASSPAAAEYLVRTQGPRAAQALGTQFEA